MAAPALPDACPRRAAVGRLRLGDFRNHPSLSLDLDARHVVLLGENGAGKTNILEALSFLSPGRGLRRATLDGVRRQGAAEGAAWSVFADVDGAEGPVSIGTGTQSGEGDGLLRRIRVNGAALASSEELLDHLRVLWLTPAQDGLFTGAASERRKFLDRLVLAIDPGHARRVSDYERAMRGRNKLLDEGGDARWLDAIEAQLAETGAAIRLARFELVGLLEAMIAREADDAFPRAGLRLAASGPALDAGQPSALLEDALRAHWSGSRRLDAAAGRTLEGPHRDDLAVIHAGKGIAADLASTGEQKGLLTGLVLAHAGLVAELSGAAPLLLLDEIAAHLDERRRAALFERIEALGGQAWMTGVDAGAFAALAARAQQVQIRPGEAQRLS